MPLAFTFPGAGEPPRPSVGVQTREWFSTVAAGIDQAAIRATVEALPAPRNRLHAAEAMDRADALILNRFHEAGWRATRCRFSYPSAHGWVDHGTFTERTVYSNLSGANIVAVREGDVGREALVVLGHHDTVRDSPGANDNGASVAAVLELARALAPYRFRRTVILATTDMEELGFFGAQALVRQLVAERPLLGVVNYETMGFTAASPGTQLLPMGLEFIYGAQVSRIRSREFRGDFTAVIYNGKATALAAWLATGLAHLAGDHVPLLLRDPNDLPLVGRLLSRVPAVRNFARSDHVPFWEAGVPAAMVTDTANFRYPHYHRATDSPDKLDFRRLADIVGATVLAVGETAQVILED